MCGWPRTVWQHKAFFQLAVIEIKTENTASSYFPELSKQIKLGQALVLASKHKAGLTKCQKTNNLHAGWLLLAPMIRTCTCLCFFSHNTKHIQYSDLLDKLHIICHLNSSEHHSLVFPCNLFTWECYTLHIQLSNASTCHVMNRVISEQCWHSDKHCKWKKVTKFWSLTHCLLCHKDNMGLLNDKGLISHWISCYVKDIHYLETI